MKLSYIKTPLGVFLTFANSGIILKMHKDFNKCNELKKNVHNIPARLFFHEREVWWCSLGANVGFEQDGKHEEFKRPVLVFKKFNNEIFWAIPLTSKFKKGKFYSKIVFGKNIKNSAILSQIRLIDAKRLVDKIGVISKKNFLEIKKAVMLLVEE